MPFTQQYESLMTLHVETEIDPATLAATVVAEIRELDAGTPVMDVQTLQHFFREGALFGNRLITQVVSVIGLFGVLLAVTGLYGVIAYSVSRRTREIGIRMAIGADPGTVARLVLRQGLTLTIIGGAIGLALSLLASQLLASLLAGVSARDPVVYVAWRCCSPASACWRATFRRCVQRESIRWRRCATIEGGAGAFACEPILHRLPLPSWLGN